MEGEVGEMKITFWYVKPCRPSYNIDVTTTITTYNNNNNHSDDNVSH
jgi:hypothetical protein